VELHTRISDFITVGVVTVQFIPALLYSRPSGGGVSAATEMGVDDVVCNALSALLDVVNVFLTNMFVCLFVCLFDSIRLFTVTV
jgi:hypothetical protein